MYPSNYDWTRFDLVFYYDQTVERLFSAWSTAVGFESFFIERARFASATGVARDPSEVVADGDSYVWTWRQGFSLDGTIHRVEPNRQIKFSFGEMTVRVSLASVRKRTELHLIQMSIPDTADGRIMGHLNCRSCWIFFLTNLKSVLESGCDLRDTDPGLVSSMEVGFRPVSLNDVGDE